MKNNENFDEEFGKLGEYYNIKSPQEVKEFLKSNTGIFALLDEAKPFIEEKFCDDKYSLEMAYDPESASCDQLVLKIYVPLERYQNGVRDDIEDVRYHLRPLRRKVRIFTEFAIRADIENV